MGHGDFTGAALELFPILDSAEEDIGRLLLGQLEITAGLVVGNGNGATHGGELHYTALNFCGLGAGDRFVSGGEIDGARNELTDTSAGTHALIVDFGTTTRSQISEPTLVDRGREGGSRAVQVRGLRGGCRATGKGSQSCQGQGLLREGHGFGLL